MHDYVRILFYLTSLILIHLPEVTHFSLLVYSLKFEVHHLLRDLYLFVLVISPLAYRLEVFPPFYLLKSLPSSHPPASCTLLLSCPSVPQTT